MPKATQPVGGRANIQTNLMITQLTTCLHHFLCKNLGKFPLRHIWDLILFFFISHHFTSLVFSQCNIINLLSDSSILFFSSVSIWLHIYLCVNICNYIIVLSYTFNSTKYVCVSKSFIHFFSNCFIVFVISCSFFFFIVFHFILLF